MQCVCGEGMSARGGTKKDLLKTIANLQNQLMTKPIKILKQGPSTNKTHGYSIDIYTGPTYHILPHEESETQQSIDLRFVKKINELIDDERI